MYDILTFFSSQDSLFLWARTRRMFCGESCAPTTTYRWREWQCRTQMIWPWSADSACVCVESLSCHQARHAAYLWYMYVTASLDPYSEVQRPRSFESSNLERMQPQCLVEHAMLAIHMFCCIWRYITICWWHSVYSFDLLSIQATQSSKEHLAAVKIRFSQLQIFRCAIYPPMGCSCPNSFPAITLASVSKPCCAWYSSAHCKWTRFVSLSAFQRRCPSKLSINMFTTCQSHTGTSAEPVSTQYVWNVMSLSECLKLIIHELKDRQGSWHDHRQAKCCLAKPWVLLHWPASLKHWTVVHKAVTPWHASHKCHSSDCVISIRPWRH